MDDRLARAAVDVPFSYSQDTAPIPNRTKRKHLARQARPSGSPPLRCRKTTRTDEMRTIACSVDVVKHSGGTMLARMVEGESLNNGYAVRIQKHCAP